VIGIGGAGMAGPSYPRTSPKPVPEVTSPATSGPLSNEDGHVLKSRSGVLAAGLSVVVVGALGAASTMGAAAEEIPGAAGSSTVVAATGSESSVAAPAAADQPTPPPFLPWGERPGTIRKGPKGASTKALRAAGLVAAPPAADSPKNPAAEFEPKGFNEGTSPTGSRRAETVPPLPPAVRSAPAKATAPANDATYFYNTGEMSGRAAGAYANISVQKPKVASTDYHSLAEVAIRDEAGTGQMIEIGWTVDPGLNGNDDPHLFVFSWINGVPQGYNTEKLSTFVPFVNVSGITAKATLSDIGVKHQLGFTYFGGNWWAAFDKLWIGHFPGSAWTNAGATFDETGVVQVFGEVAARGDAPCTDMGNGVSGTSSDAAKVNPVGWATDQDKTDGLITPPSSADMDISGSDNATGLYQVYTYATTKQAFRYGGPGAC
jgi:hypothetical protein